MTKPAVCCLLLAAGLNGQAAPAKKPADAPPDPLLLLYNRARAALADVPADVAPDDWLALGAQERIRYPDQAREDIAQAFRLALALPAAKEDSGGEERFHYAMKYNTELDAISALKLDPKGFPVAHELARVADVPRYRLYTELIAAAADQAEKKAGVQFPAEQGLLSYMNGGVGYAPAQQVTPPTGLQPEYDALALAKECQALDGTFPFLGVLIALEAYHRDDNDQRPLVLASYDAAASEHDAIALSASVGVLTRGHRLYPDLDARLESTATAMLANLQDQVQHPPAATGSSARDQQAQGMTQSEIRTGASLLALLDQVDPARAEELKSQYAVFANPQKPRIFKISDLTARQRADNDDPATAVGKLAAMPADADPQKQAKFKAAMNLAISLAEKNPVPASQAADIALNLMTDDLLAANYERVALLAARMGVNLHQNAEADDLLKRCLDLAESNARKAEEAYDSASPDDWGKLAGDFQGIGSAEVETFTFAAMADPVLAETRAEQTSATYFKPLFLLRVALGQEMQKPWWQ